MKRRKTVIICLTVVMVLAVTVVVAVKMMGIGSHIALSNAKNVIAIEMYQTEGLNSQADIIRVTLQDDINTILAALTTARQTSLSWYSAANDGPLQPNCLVISIISREEQMSTRLYLYGEETVYAPYIGIYRISNLKYEEIKQIYINSAK